MVGGAILDGLILPRAVGYLSPHLSLGGGNDRDPGRSLWHSSVSCYTRDIFEYVDGTSMGDSLKEFMQVQVY